jgi:formylmethanofuran dehydrogenase subunit E
MNCDKCNHKIINSEHYIKLEDDSIMCEDCFLEYSLNKLNAELKQNTNKGEI